MVMSQRQIYIYWLLELFILYLFPHIGEKDAVSDVRQLSVPPVGQHDGEGAEEEGGALPGVHRGLQHPRARPHQVEGQALRGAGQDSDQAGGEVKNQKAMEYTPLLR